MTTTMSASPLALALSAVSAIPAGERLPITLLLDGRTATALAGRGIPLRQRADNPYGKGAKRYYLWAPECPQDQRLTPQRETYNMLNPAAGKFMIDEDTPRYCDPASEAYHSM